MYKVALKPKLSNGIQLLRFGSLQQAFCDIGLAVKLSYDFPKKYKILLDFVTVIIENKYGLSHRLLKCERKPSQQNTFPVNNQVNEIVNVH